LLDRLREFVGEKKSPRRTVVYHPFSLLSERLLRPSSALLEKTERCRASLLVPYVYPRAVAAVLIEEEKKEKEDDTSNWRWKEALGGVFPLGVFGQRAQKLSFVQTCRTFMNYHISIHVGGVRVGVWDV
jgi:hypothetical protein